jgi:hypothetical protein
MNDGRHVLILGGGIAHRTVHTTLLDPPAVRIRAGVSTPV